MLSAWVGWASWAKGPCSSATDMWLMCPLHHRCRPAPLPLLQRHAQAQEALDALPAQRELVQQHQELQVSRMFYRCRCRVASCWQVGMVEVLRQQFRLLLFSTCQPMLMRTYSW